MKMFLVIPTLKQGGAERIMSELANNFNGLGHEVHLCLLVSCEDFYEIDEGVIIHRLGFENKSRIQKKISEISTLFKLRRLMKQETPEVALSFMDKYNVFTILASRFLKIKVFVSDRSNPNKQISSSLQYLKKLTYKHATGIVAQTSLAKEILLKTIQNSNIRVIHNPLKEIELHPTIEREKIILNIGRLVPEKGQKFLINAFSKIENKGWNLVILGNGNLKNQLEKQIIDLNLKGKVQMPGAVKDIDEWLARASIFVFPSISEGFPNALVEAMAAGLPCVSFDCDAGPKDIIDNNTNGFLIESKNIDYLVKAIENLCSDTELRAEIGAEASKIRSILDAKVITADYLSFFNQEIK